MGTYTTHYQLFMPSISEQGWGELVNNNFSTIDTTMAGLNTRVGTLETDMDAVETRVTTLEAGEFESANIGTLTFDSIVMPTLSYDGFYNMSVPQTGGYVFSFIIYSTPFPISGKVSIKYSGNARAPYLIIVTNTGLIKQNITTTQTEYTISNAYTIVCYYSTGNTSDAVFTIGTPKLV